MGIFNIQSLRDKYLSDSGVPAEQDSRGSSAKNTAARRKSTGSSQSSLQEGVARLSARHDLPSRSSRKSQAPSSAASQKRTGRDDESRSQRSHHSGPVTSSMPVLAARDIAVAEAEARRAEERAAAEKKKAAEERAQRIAEARRRASVLPGTAGQRPVGGSNRRGAAPASSPTQPIPTVRKTKSITIGEFHGSPSKRKKKPEQQITKPAKTSAELDPTVLMDTNDVRAAARRSTTQRKPKQQNPRVENAAERQSAQKPVRKNSPRTATARIPITQRSTTSRSQAPGGTAAQQGKRTKPAPQRAAQPRTASAKAPGTKTGAQKIRPKSSIAKNPAARNAALKNTVRSNLARQANEQLAQREQSPAQTQPHQPAQQSQAAKPQQTPRPTPESAESASSRSAQSQTVQTRLTQSDPGYSPAKIVAAAQARARQDSQQPEKSQAPQQQAKQTPASNAYNPWNGLPTPQKKPAAANPWNTIPAAKKQNPWDQLPAMQKRREPSASEKLANKPEFAGFDMEKLLQPGYQPQTRKEAIAIRRAREELHLQNKEAQRSPADSAQPQENDAARREREEVHRQRLAARRRREAEAQRTRAEAPRTAREAQNPRTREQREQNQAQPTQNLTRHDNTNTRSEQTRSSQQSVRARDAASGSTRAPGKQAAQSTTLRSAPVQAPVHPTSSVRPVKRTASHASPFKLAPGEVRSGVVRRRRLAPRLQGPMEAVFVCTGNVARSAAAEIIASQLSEEYGLTDDWVFTSAGTSALSGSRVYRYVGKQLDERGYDISGYRAKQLTEDMVERATLLLVAEAEHADWIIREWPQYHHKVHLIKQVAHLRKEAGSNTEPLSYLYSHNQAPRSSDNIGDPYRQGREAARIAVDEIENSLFEILPWLSMAQVQR